MTETTDRTQPQEPTLDPQHFAYVASQRVARLATADRQGRPHVVPVCYAFTGQHFYIALDDKPKRVPPVRLRRVRNILQNPHVAMLIDTYYEDWSRLTYVLATGTAALEPPGTHRHAEGLSLLRDKYPQYRDMRIDLWPVIVVTPQSYHTWAGHAGQSRWGPEQEGQHAPPPRTELDFASLARGRHVVRRFLPLPVPRHLVEMTIEAARWAPSPHGAQPWRFVIITRHDLKHALAEAMADEWRRNLEMDGEPPDVVETRLRNSKQRIIGTPVLIIPCLYMEDMHRYPDPQRQQAETIMAIQSLGAAVQNLLLSAYSLGLDTGWMCAPLFCPDVVRAVLDLPPTLTPHAIINLGYAAKHPPRRPHRPISELIVRYD
jgi:PPOX class probable F420-dependent enzyme